MHYSYVRLRCTDKAEVLGIFISPRREELTVVAMSVLGKQTIVLQATPCAERVWLARLGSACSALVSEQVRR